MRGVNIGPKYKIVQRPLHTAWSPVFGNKERFYDSVADLSEKNISTSLLDLVDIMSAAFEKDCEVKRGINWRRSLFVSVAVRELNLWQRSDVKDALENALKFTGDEWHFNFLSKSHSGQSIMPNRMNLRQSPSGSRAFLASEGADSCCGMVVRSAEDAEGHFLGMNCVTEHVRAQQLERFKQWLPQHFQITHHRVSIQRHGQKTNEERSQRSRSFLLLALGVLAASTIGDHNLEIYENGIEAFNFPLYECLEPERLSRVMHPILVSRMQKLVSLVCGDENVVLSMPFLFKTKAQLISLAQQSIPENAIYKTVSCIHYSSRKIGSAHCGQCVGCILRRVSLRVCGLQEPVELLPDKDMFSIDEQSKANWIELGRLNSQMEYLRGKLKKSADDEIEEVILALSALPWYQIEELVGAAATLTGTTEEDAKSQILHLHKDFLKEWDSVFPQIKVLSNPQHVLAA